VVKRIQASAAPNTKGAAMPAMETAMALPICRRMMSTRNSSPTTNM
jgi:hypothetical protein